MTWLRLATSSSARFGSRQPYLFVRKIPYVIRLRGPGGAKAGRFADLGGLRGSPQPVPPHSQTRRSRHPRSRPPGERTRCALGALSTCHEALRLRSPRPLREPSRASGDARLKRQGDQSRRRSVTENFDIDVICGKALRVLGHAEFFEPVRKVLHRAAPSGDSRLASRHDTQPTLRREQAVAPRANLEAFETKQRERYRQLWVGGCP
jgi:hypothetical protein